MSDILDKKFTNCYTPKIKEFVALIEGENHRLLPEPFIPVYGKGYSKSPVKIMFMGWETRKAHGLEEFVKCANENMQDALYWFSEEFDDFEFRHWRSNLGKDFWTFNLRFLAKFHGVADWKEFVRDDEKHGHILNGFAWANCDSIERYNVTAQNNGVSISDWRKIKAASEIFDSPQLIFNALEPDLVILLHWQEEEDWLLAGLQVVSESEPHPYLWHYNCLLNSREIQIFWTRHPRGMPNMGIDYDIIIDEIISIYGLNVVKKAR
ncbi:MAG TPA: hypothetical protein VK588_12280 [Chitinophagaceae bacterium]|nr:hypothetical protein [Chitinophagaceae bacterium]